LPPPETRDQRALAMLTSIHPDTRLLRKLIALGGDLNHRRGDMSALVAATRDSLRGRADTVLPLLAHGAQPRAADGEGRTPLHFAALSSEPDVAALLIDAGAQLDAVNRDGFTRWAWPAPTATGASRASCSNAAPRSNRRPASPRCSRPPRSR